MRGRERVMKKEWKTKRKKRKKKTKKGREEKKKKGKMVELAVR